MFGSSLNYSSTAHPHMDGQAKDVNYISGNLPLYFGERPKQYDFTLAEVEFVYDSTIHSAAKSPSVLCIRRL